MSSEDHPSAVSVGKGDTSLPPENEADLDYVRDIFIPLAVEHRGHVEVGILPKATYELPDGTPMVPGDHAQLLKDADDDPSAVKGLFQARFIAAGGGEQEAEQAYAEWLSGDYGACLWCTTPEMIVLKGSLMSAIEALIAGPQLGSRPWETALRHAVDALDAIERPFAEYDRVRWEPSLSRDRLITEVRARYPGIWPGA
ncbi:MAG TPA: DUF6058 family natural product biosynthesis protein [Solirubrobacteraceae bacterium]|jgi:hypothetical protein|nr:DUF6058 family natural product biosynthesis protein [Solirubrobacteraceae bacterium]